MGDKYDIVKQYYDLGMWSEGRVRNAVVKGWITAEGFCAICGKEY